jgi:pimeloyl-ACP methyl ester carboxylesterase
LIRAIKTSSEARSGTFAVVEFIMKAHINGFDIECTDGGISTGMPIVLIHGFPFSKEMWKPQVKRLSGNYRVVTYDVRGHGGSEVGDGQYMLEFFVDDLFELLRHLGIEEGVLVGLSMGGYIALRAIERNPGVFRALVLCDTCSDADTNEAKLKRADAIRTIKSLVKQAFSESLLKAVLAP